VVGPLCRRASCPTRKGDCCDATEAWKKERGTGSQQVTAEDIAQIASTLTGVPVSELTGSKEVVRSKHRHIQGPSGFT
jgi:ATP-dependent Clp protease ATP-binding subunit ClpA